MRTQEIFKQMINKASELPIEEIKRILIEDNNQPVLPNEVFQALMDALELKISEDKFLKFLITYVS